MTEQTQPTGQPAAFPEMKIRHNFDQTDAKTIQGHWTSWDESRRVDFGKLVEETPEQELDRKVDAFMRGGEDGTGTPTPAQDSPAGTQPPADTANGGSDGQTSGGQQNDGELEAALDTIESAEDYADEHPDQIDALLAAEQQREKPRKTLVESLERAQRRRDRDAAEGKQGE